MINYQLKNCTVKENLSIDAIFLYNYLLYLVDTSINQQEKSKQFIVYNVLSYTYFQSCFFTLFSQTFIFLHFLLSLIHLFSFVSFNLPSNNSKLAPPPVETWLTLSSVPNLAAHVAVSPPPEVKLNVSFLVHICIFGYW